MKKIVLLALVLLMAGAAAFAQSDDDFVDAGGTPGNFEFGGGLQLNMDFNLKDDTSSVSPALVLLWRQYLTPVTDEFQIGYTVNLAVGVRTWMDWKVPAVVARDALRNYTELAGETITFKLGETIPWNISLLTGVSFMGKIDDNWGYVFDGGIGINVDVISADTRPAWMEVVSNNFQLHEDIMAVNIGLAANIGIQFHYGDKMLIEGGVNLGYSFFKMNTINIYMYRSNQSGEKIDNGYSEAGAFEPVSILRIGLPYLVIGLKL